MPASAGMSESLQLLHVQRLCADRLAGGIERDFFHPRFRKPQQFLAAALQRLAAFVDRDRFLERHIAALELLHDLLKLRERLLEAESFDVGICSVGHLQSVVSASRVILAPNANLILRRAEGPSRRMVAGSALAAILRDAMLRMAPQDEVERSPPHQRRD